MLLFNRYFVEYKHDRLSVTDTKEGSTFKYAPGETTNIVSLISQTVGFLEMPALPECIEAGAFKVSFNEVGDCVLSRSEDAGYLKFNRDSYDHIVQAMEVLLNSYTDTKRLKGQRRGRASGMNYPDPIV